MLGGPANTIFSTNKSNRRVPRPSRVCLEPALSEAEGRGFSTQVQSFRSPRLARNFQVSQSPS